VVRVEEAPPVTDAELLERARRVLRSGASALLDLEACVQSFALVVSLHLERALLVVSGLLLTAAPRIRAERVERAGSGRTHLLAVSRT
jgi:hypothetical protein